MLQTTKLLQNAPQKLWEINETYELILIKIAIEKGKKFVRSIVIINAIIITILAHYSYGIMIIF